MEPRYRTNEGSQIGPECTKAACLAFLLLWLRHKPQDRREPAAAAARNGPYHHAGSTQTGRHPPTGALLSSSTGPPSMSEPTTLSAPFQSPYLPPAVPPLPPGDPSLASRTSLYTTSLTASNSACLRYIHFRPHCKLTSACKALLAMLLTYPGSTVGA